MPVYISLHLSSRLGQKAGLADDPLLDNSDALLANRRGLGEVVGVGKSKSAVAQGASRSSAAGGSGTGVDDTTNTLVSRISNDSDRETASGLSGGTLEGSIDATRGILAETSSAVKEGRVVPEELAVDADKLSGDATNGGADSQRNVWNTRISGDELTTTAQLTIGKDESGSLGTVSGGKRAGTTNEAASLALLETKRGSVGRQYTKDDSNGSGAGAGSSDGAGASGRHGAGRSNLSTSGLPSTSGLLSRGRKDGHGGGDLSLGGDSSAIGGQSGTGGEGDGREAGVSTLIGRDDSKNLGKLAALSLDSTALERGRTTAAELCRVARACGAAVRIVGLLQWFLSSTAEAVTRDIRGKAILTCGALFSTLLGIKVLVRNAEVGSEGALASGCDEAAHIQDDVDNDLA